MGNKSSKLISGIKKIKGGRPTNVLGSDSPVSKAGTKRSHAEEMSGGCQSDEDSDTSSSQSPER